MVSSVVERRIVELGVDDKQLNNGLTRAASSIQSFSKSMNSINESGLDKVGSSADSASGAMSKLGDGVQQTASKFSVLEGAAAVALGNILTKAITTATQLANKFTLRPIIDGFQEYERELESTRILTSALGKEQEGHITAVMRDLEQYAKTTRYASQQMNSSLAQFVNAGVDIDKAGIALKGWGNLAASAGASNAQFANSLQFAVQQALQMGYMNLMNWRSVQNANMATQEFKDTLIDTGLAQGTLTQEMLESYGAQGLFMDALADTHWMTNDVLIEALNKYATTDKFLEMAENVYTFGEAMETVGESVNDAWSKFWVEAIGKGDRARAIWTPFATAMSDLVSAIPNMATEYAKVFNQKNGLSHIIELIKTIWTTSATVFKAVGSAFQKVFGVKKETFIDGLLKSIDNITNRLRPGEGLYAAVQSISTFVFNIAKGLIGIAQRVAQIFEALVPDDFITGLLEIGAAITDVFNALFDMKSGTDAAKKSNEIFNDSVKALGAVVNAVFKIIVALAKVISTVLVSGIRIADKMFGGVFKTIGKFLGLATGKEMDDASEKQKNFAERVIDVAHAIEQATDFFVKILDRTGSLSDAWEGLYLLVEQFAQKSTFFSFVKGLMDVFERLWKITKPVRDGLRAIGSYLFGVFAIGLEKLVGVLDKVIKKMGALKIPKLKMPKLELPKLSPLSSMKVSADEVDGGQTAEVERKVTVLDTVVAKLQVVWDKIKSVFVSIRDLFSSGDIFKYISNLVDSLGGLQGILKIGFQATGLMLLYKTLKNISSVFQSFGNISDATVGVLNGVRGALKGYQTQLKARALKDIGVAILEIAAAMYVLSLIPADKLGPVSKAILAAATALSIAAIAMAKAKSMLPTESPKDSAIQAITDQLIPTEAKDLMKKIGNSVLILSLAGSALMIANAVKKFADMNWDEIFKGVTGLGLVLLELTGAAWLTGKSKNTFGNALTILALTKAVNLIADSIKKLSKFNSTVFQDGMLRLTAIAGVLTAAVALMSGDFSLGGKVTGINIKTGNVNFGTMGTLWQVVRGIQKLSAVVEEIASSGISQSKIDSAIDMMGRLGNVITKCIAFMNGSFNIGYKGTSVGGGKAVLGGNAGIQASWGTMTYKTVAAIAVVVWGIKSLANKALEIANIPADKMESGVKTIQKIGLVITAAVGVMGANIKLPGGTNIGIGGSWATAGTAFIVVMGILSLSKLAEHLGEVDQTKLESGRHTVEIMALVMTAVYGAISYISTISMIGPNDLILLGEIVLGLVGLAYTMVKLGTVPQEQLSLGKTTMDGIYITLTSVYAVLSLVSSMSVVGTGDLILLGGIILGFVVVAGALALLGRMDQESLRMASVSLAIVMGMMTLMIGVAGLVSYLAPLTSGVLLSAALAIAATGLALWMLKDVNGGQLLAAGLAIVGVISAVLVVAALATPAIPTLLALSVAVLAIGAAILMAGAGFKLFAEGVSIFINAIINLGTAIGDAINSANKNIQGVGKLIGDFFTKTLPNWVINGLGSMIRAIGSGIGQVVGKLGELASKAVSKIASFAGKFFQPAVNWLGQMAQGIGSAFGKVTGKLGNLWENIKSKIGSWSLVQQGIRILSSFGEGFANAFAAVKKKVGDIVDGIIGFVKGKGSAGYGFGYIAETLDSSSKAISDILAKTEHVVGITPVVTGGLADLSLTGSSISFDTASIGSLQSRYAEQANSLNQITQAVNTLSSKVDTLNKTTSIQNGLLEDGKTIQTYLGSDMIAEHITRPVTIRQNDIAARQSRIGGEAPSL